MSIYGPVQENFESVAQRFRRKGESVRISKPVVMGGSKYYGLIYKSFVGSDLSGLILIDEYGAVVKGDVLQELLEVFYYYNLFFDTTVVDLNTALKSDSWLKREKLNYFDACRMLIILSDQGMEGAMDVKDIVDEIPSMSQEENDALKAFLNKVKEYEDEEVVFSRDIMDKLIPMYEGAVLMNFQKVKFINTGKGYYNAIIREISGRGRKLKSIFNRGQQSASLNLESIVTFFLNVLEYYGDSVNMSDEDYIESVKKNHKDNMKKWYGKLREK